MPPSAGARAALGSTEDPPVDFTQRADLSEWMDEPCPYETLLGCLQSLEQVNRLTGSYRPTLAFLNRIVAQNPGAPLHIVDVGSGYGDMLRQIRLWAIRHDIIVTLTGIDLNPNCGRAAFEADDLAGVPPGEIRWITGDAFRAASQPIDVVLSSLFTHHLPPWEIVHFLDWMDRNARRGWFINDLERQAFPYHAYNLLARLLRWHPYVRHDGPISFRRAFRHRDWERMLTDAAIHPAGTRVFRAFPARLCVERIR